MTVPIVPGPFSFLQSAGEAAGAVGTALEQKRKRLDDEARARLMNILGLIEQGAEPATFASSGGAALERLGLAEPGQGQAVLQGPAERARLTLNRLRSETETAGATAKTATAAADRAPRTAEAATVTAEQGAEQAKITTQAAGSDLPVRQRINELITTELKNPETNFGRLAARAAAGTLPFYTSYLQLRYGQDALARERQRELFTLLFEPLDNASRVWQERLQEWERRKQLALLGREDDQKFTETWEAQNPKPALSAVQQELLENAATARGMTVETYNRKLNEAVGLVSEVEESTLPPAKLQALQQRVGAVLSGSKTADQIVQEIRIFYRQRGGANSQLDEAMDIVHFRRLLAEAQGGTK